MQLTHLPHPLVIAHRGYRTKYPENTLTAFKAAIDAGAAMIELDVTLTRDRKLIVIHDDTLERTTDGHGRVAQATLAELKKLDAGTWFDSAFAGERLPTLEEVFELARGRVLINIEIKPEAYEAHSPPDAIEHQVLELMRRHQVRDQVLISSFEWPILTNIASIPDRPALAVLTERAADTKTLEMCQHLDAFSVNPDYRVLTLEQVKLIHAHDIRVLPYTVNTLEEARRLLEMGVDGFFSDDPLLLN